MKKELCTECQQRPIFIKKYGLCKSCYERLRYHKKIETKLPSIEERIKRVYEKGISPQLRWQRINTGIEFVSYLAKHYSYLLNVIYECPCNHPKKHDHHFDYSRPFEVLRLCPDCHSKEHIRLRQLENQAQEA